jgi:hypothetical protein
LFAFGFETRELLTGEFESHRASREGACQSRATRKLLRKGAPVLQWRLILAKPIQTPMKQSAILVGCAALLLGFVRRVRRRSDDGPA